MANSKNFRRLPTDAHTDICWTLDESSVSSYVNSGTGGSLGLGVSQAGTGYNQPGAMGIHGFALDLGPVAGGTTGTPIVQSSGNTTTIGESTSQLTVSFWLKPHQFISAANGGFIFSKNYQTKGTWTSPFLAHGIQFNNSSTDGATIAYITTGGSLSSVTMQSWTRLRLEWNLISYTYDSTKASGQFNVYINSVLAGTISTGGAGTLVDYGTHGPYTMGGVNAGAASQPVDCIYDDIRVESIVRPQAYFEEMYRRAIGYTSSRT